MAGMERQGKAGLGKVWQGMAWQAWCGLARLAEFGRGVEWPGRQGWARRDGVGHRRAWQAWPGEARLGGAWRGKVRLGVAGGVEHGKAGCGPTRMGQAR